MKNKYLVAIAIAVALLGGAGLYALLSEVMDKGASAPVAKPGKSLTYVDVGKTVVLLHGTNGESNSRYAVIEAVLEVETPALGKVKQELLLIRSLVFRAVAAYSAEQLRALSVDEVTSAIEKAIQEHEHAVGTRVGIERVMLTSLVIE
ncbi:flagellar basal body-associated FliL family protein [Chitinasiproducens palmae]|uniref:Flagellar protein FliL n=1 Tax=Chitinasiproducens palmae TaxID=1770053 RepID=A0A1H2PKH2_9BURK|nr:flagellar basal body-associated FliL family protein [Chitinasiproducens palmae]SDV46942.1 Flagellar basal body-associated protein FliL [Chitinasiproducens palmae]